ncbi:uncharacterized protein LOC133951358 isoform X2 [Platichthys flesus]|uniref:uncharacterized protein LOC133951358 isoform X2 n=1 Tax=Platichthys flesus TaxID=8260 RepID=UPI002DB6AD8F|nr:uncharacterized protein LOC133951358 isoform X2 [Platichthys flesus]
MRTHGTQLSMKTLRPHYKSTGTQKTVLHCCRCWDLSCKRPRLEEGEDNPSCSSMDFREPQDATYDPDDSITVLTESEDVTMESSNPVHKTPTYIVYENCLLELFELCPVCRRGTDVIYKQGECTAKPVKADAAFHYVDNLLDLIFHEVFQDPAPYVNELLKISKPEDLSAKYKKPDKQEVIASYVSSFNQVQV